MNNYSYVLMALVATIFTWFITSVGAAVVYFFKKVNKDILDAIVSIAAGVMIAASYFSLLAPSIEMSQKLGLNKIISTTIGFICGGFLILFMNKLFSKKYTNKKKRCLMLVSSITLHNIPEGLAVGVAFGSIIYNLDGASLTNAIALAIGIAIQNFPEGVAISIPLRRDGLSRTKAFIIGSLSALVEPISGVIGALLVLKIRVILPFLLSFAAGAMIYVVVSELIPECTRNKNKNLISMCSIIGFSVMMILDVLLG